MINCFRPCKNKHLGCLKPQKQEISFKQASCGRRREMKWEPECAELLVSAIMVSTVFRQHNDAWSRQCNLHTKPWRSYYVPLWPVAADYSLTKPLHMARLIIYRPNYGHGEPWTNGCHDRQCCPLSLEQCFMYLHLLMMKLQDLLRPPRSLLWEVSAISRRSFFVFD